MSYHINYTCALPRRAAPPPLRKYVKANELVMCEYLSMVPAAQWLRFWASDAGVRGSMPVGWFAGKTIPSPWGDRHPAIKSPRPPGHHAGHSTGVQKDSSESSKTCVTIRVVFGQVGFDRCLKVGAGGVLCGSSETRKTSQTFSDISCDIHTDAHAQDSLYNEYVEEMGTVGCLSTILLQGHGYEFTSS